MFAAICYASLPCARRWHHQDFHPATIAHASHRINLRQKKAAYFTIVGWEATSLDSVFR